MINQLECLYPTLHHVYIQEILHEDLGRFFPLTLYLLFVEFDVIFPAQISSTSVKVMMSFYSFMYQTGLI